MPKTGLEVKEKRTTQYGGGWAKHAYGPLHPLSNRRRRHRD